MQVEYLDRTFEIEVDSFSPYVPAKLNGLPEDCYPEEGEELEFHCSEDNNDCEFLDFMLEQSDCFRASIEEQIIEELTND